MSVMNWIARMWRKTPGAPTPAPSVSRPVEDNVTSNHPPQSDPSVRVERHFYNQPGFQTYGSFFTLWNGWATAGHVLSEASDLLPNFCTGTCHSWPGGLDAALIGCTLPPHAPEPPRIGQDIIVRGYPAGSRHIEQRRARVYHKRQAGTWIAHIIMPDEPVVTGMSGGVVADALTGEAIGILITRNSPADLNADRDPDESCDFVALSDVWHAVSALQNESALIA